MNLVKGGSGFIGLAVNPKLICLTSIRCKGRKLSKEVISPTIKFSFALPSFNADETLVLRDFRSVNNYPAQVIKGEFLQPCNVREAGYMR